MPDRIFSQPLLAAIYDDVDADRSDLDHYEAILAEFGARSVVDIGCGTGVFACRMARRGLTVIGADPAQASLDVARAKAGADLVTWVVGDATALPTVAVDAVTMTGNVAQVFVHDADWVSTLTSACKVLGNGGHLLFESRDPAFRGWEEWTKRQSMAVTRTALGRVQHWVELTDVELPLVSFRHTFRFLDGADEPVTSDSTLLFRTRDEIADALVACGLNVVDVREAPDRPNREMVFIATPAFN